MGEDNSFLDLYNFEIKLVSEKVKKKGSKRVLLQLPDGLRPQAFKIIKSLRESTEADYFLDGDSCYGGCDLAIHNAKTVRADLIIHYGHSRMVSDETIEVIYVDAKFDFNSVLFAEFISPLLTRWRKIGLATTIQHAHQLKEIAEYLNSKGFMTFIGPKGEWTKEGGQVLGCDYNSAITVANEVECFLFIGGGRSSFGV